MVRVAGRGDDGVRVVEGSEGVRFDELLVALAVAVDVFPCVLSGEGKRIWSDPNDFSVLLVLFSCP